MRRKEFEPEQRIKRQQRYQGTGKSVPNYDLLARNEGPAINSNNHTVDPDALIKELNAIARFKRPWKP